MRQAATGGYGIRPYGNPLRGHIPYAPYRIIS